MNLPRKPGWWSRNWVYFARLVPVGLVLICVMVMLLPRIGLIPPHGTQQSQEAYNTAASQHAYTRATQQRLMAAIDAYRKTTGAVPDVVFDPDSSDPDKYMPARQVALLLAKLQGAGPDDPVYKATRPFLGDDPERSTRDGYGKTMLYVKDGGVGGKPVILSAGPDGKFGYGGKTDGATTNAPIDKQAQKDNIRSDMN